MTAISEGVPADSLMRAAGGFALVASIVSLAGVVFILLMFALFARSNQALGMTFGLLNDICVAIQYLLTIPIALALYRMLAPTNRPLITAATVVGIVMMLVIIVLQMLLVFEVLTFEQQGVWASLAILVGVGSWLMITGLVAKSAGVLPRPVLMSAIAVPYFGFPAWAFWLGKTLLGR